MTDIRQHLRGLLKILREELAAPDPIDKGAVRQQVADYLPSSYGIASGVIVDDVGKSTQPFDIIIYDQPLADGAYTTTHQTFLAQHVLGAFVVDQTMTPDRLFAALQTVQGLKRLNPREPKKMPTPSRSPGVFGAKIPTHRLPLSMICFHQLSGAEPVETIYQYTQQIRAQHCPEYIYAVGHQIAYRNPLIDKLHLSGHETGLSRLPNLHRPQNCYVCKVDFHRRHFFYDQMCQSCGDVNFAHRHQTTDMDGRLALVTGGRVKLGFAVTLKLLRAGASVIVTTRFPLDAAQRYLAEPDFDQWKDRLHIYGLDLRSLPGVGLFIDHLYTSYPHLDILINNAAQTVRRPPAYYAHLLPFERTPPAQLSPAIRSLVRPINGAGNSLASGANGAALSLFNSQTLEISSSAEMSQIALVDGDATPDAEQFPPDQFDEDGQQLDRRTFNSWVMRIDDVSMPEILEVQLINVTAPTLLVSRLKGLMERSPFPARFIVNVSSVEGQFAQEKQSIHVHTNMAKAALNMLTHSSAEQYAASGIYMNSVDPGWISHQAPGASIDDIPLPIDMLDGAARICDPIFNVLNGQSPTWGKFLKDYQVNDW
nr:SDR family oxidoreductase [Anaerolineae bacterium]